MKLKAAYLFKKSKAFGFTLLALFSSFVLCAFFLILLGYNPISIYKIVLDGSIGSNYGLMKSLAKATPLIFTGLAVFFADQAGLFNIGAEGQLLIGGVSCGIFGYFFSTLNMNPTLSILLCLLLSFFLGSIWGLIPGWLKAYWETNEFIVSMMMNYVATFLCEYLVTYPFRGPGVTAKTNEIPNEYLLPRVVADSQLNYGLLIGIIAIILVLLFFKFTNSGFEIKAMGKNIDAACSAGINIKSKTIFVFAVSGGIAALAGATEVLGVHGFFINDLSPGYGFDGIAVSVLSQGNPLGVLFSSLLFGALRAGGSRLDLKSTIPSEFIIILQAIVIIFIATPKIMRIFNKRRRKNV